MNKLTTNEPEDPGQEAAGNEVPADAFSPVVDPGLVPGETSDEERALNNEDKKQS